MRSTLRHAAPVAIVVTAALLGSAAGAQERGRSFGLYSGSLAALKDAIGSGGYLWIDDSSGELVDTQAVGTWTDLIQGFAATQGTGSKQPVAQLDVTTGFLEVVFDSTDDLLDTIAFPAAWVQPTTLYVVMRDTDAPAALRFVVDGIVSDKRHTMNPDSQYRMYAGINRALGGTPDNTTHLETAEFNTASSGLFLDGVQQGSTADAGTHDLTGITIGAGFGGLGPWGGEILAVAMKNALRETAIEDELIAYLNLDREIEAGEERVTESGEKRMISHL